MSETEHVESNTPRVNIEREVKLLAPPELRMPKFDLSTSGLVGSPPRRQRLVAAYFDTSDLALARFGVTLRHRSGDAAAPWTLKLPIAVHHNTVTRSELTFAGTNRHVPAAVADLVRAYSRSRPLVNVATLRTTRCTVDIHQPTGQRVAELVDDTVSVYDGNLLVNNFREIEVELLIGGDLAGHILSTIEHLLLDAGAVDDTPLPKLVRALSPRASANPDVLVKPLTARHSSARRLVRHSIAASLVQMIRHDAGVRLGDDPEAVHALRVATRKLRSHLRTFAPLLDPEANRSLRDELSWLASSLGVVRENEVLAERLHQREPLMPKGSAASLRRLIELLAQQRLDARLTLLADMRSPRYDRLIDNLVRAAHRPPFSTYAKPALRQSAAEVGTQFTAHAWRSLEHLLRAAGDAPSPDTLHEIRIRAKRARYAADLIESIIGEPATRLSDAASSIQALLGEHHDSALAEQWLREVGRTRTRPDPAVEYLIACEQRDRGDLEVQWARLSHQVVTDKKATKWLRSNSAHVRRNP